MHKHINKLIIDYSNNFISMPRAQGSCAQKEFQIYVTCAVDLCYLRI